MAHSRAGQSLTPKCARHGGLGGRAAACATCCALPIGWGRAAASTICLSIAGSSCGNVQSYGLLALKGARSVLSTGRVCLPAAWLANAGAAANAFRAAVSLWGWRSPTAQMPEQYNTWQ